MTDKKPTVAALQRKIERLEAQIEALKQERDKAWSGYGTTLGNVVDLQARVALLSAKADYPMSDKTG